MNKHPAGHAYRMPDTEVAMFLDTWYTVLSYPPRCKALLESVNQAGLFDIFPVNDPRTANMIRPQHS